jgi:hypothetical protein
MDAADVVSIRIEQIFGAGWRIYGMKLCYGKGNLRKTALGASSPAKPALHIPELSHQSVKYSSSMISVRIMTEKAQIESEKLLRSGSYPTILSVKDEECANSPIVNNEGCNFFCTVEITSANDR